MRDIVNSGNSFPRINLGDSLPQLVESLWKIYTEVKIVPMTFKPTGETVYVTAQMRDWIERGKEQLQKEDK